MVTNLTSYIDLLTPWIPTSIVSEPYLYRIRAIGNELPVLSFGCFECWLAGDEPRIDINIAISGKLNEHRTVLQWLTNAPKPDSGSQYNALQKLQSICRAWSDSHYFLHSHIRLLWLVYDLPDPVNVTPAPWMYIHFQQNRFVRDADIRPEIILQTLALMDNRYTHEEREAFRAFFQSVSPSVHIYSIGLANRGANVLRVYWMMQRYEDLLRLLNEHQWPGDVEELQLQMRHLLSGCDFFGLSIDINPAIQPKIGIECWFNEDHLQDRLLNFTNLLLERGLCSIQKQEALLGWNGAFETTTHPMFWSWPDAEKPAIINQPKRVVIRKMAHYIKLVYEPGKPLVAKGYLYYDRLLKNS